MRTPVVGLSTYSTHADWGSWAGEACLTPRTYIDQVIRAGAVPVLLPAATSDESVIVELVASIDALVLIGGEDVCGVFTETAEDDGAHATHSSERDQFEIALAQQAWKSGTPILAICRGAQVLNVSRGGTLIADLPTAGFSDQHRPTPGTFHNHDVVLTDGSRVAHLYGPTASVPSHHHQAVDTPGSDLHVTARADDGVIEAIEAIDADRFAVGVQWHPEEADNLVLFTELVQQARQRQ